MIESKFPNQLDDATTLFTVHDSLKVPLGEDYNPGDNKIIAGDDISRFPATGFITLVDQCSKIKERAISFYYKERTNREFVDVEIFPDSINSFKPKQFTSVTQQVMAETHNNLIDVVIAIENFLGTRHADNSSIFGRINFLQKLLFVPNAWFEVTRSVGLAPFTVTFTSKSSGINGPVGSVIYTWDFGDGNIDSSNSAEIIHTYSEPGLYTVSMTVKNEFGTDTIVFEDMIKVKAGAPEEAIIKFLPKANQILKDNRIRTPVNQPITIEVEDSGEIINPDSQKPFDPIISYTWNLSDDLSHKSSMTTKASYSLGGLYDVVLRTNTKFGSYRNTVLEDAIDVVENTNLWLWLNLNPHEVQSFEFGLFSETFKAKANNTYTVNINDSFISDEPKHERMKKEFLRNNGSTSADGKCLLYWATGRDSSDAVASEKIEFASYSGFTDLYTTPCDPIDRPWNWVSLSSPSSLYFIMGCTPKQPSSTSPTNQNKTAVNLASLVPTNTDFGSSDYRNGAKELMRNSLEFDDNGQPLYGHFSTYRSAWKDQAGYLLRSKNIGQYFPLTNFYRTEGTFIEPFMGLVKLVDLPTSKMEDGQLVTLKNGIYFFGDSGSLYLYNDLTDIWKTEEINSNLWGNLEESSQSLLASGDEEGNAYLSFDYNTSAFFKYNEIDSTFKTLPERPYGNQWIMTVF